MQLKDHIVLVTGAAGTLGSAMCQAIEAAGGTAIRSDLAGRGKIDIALDVTKEDDWKAAAAEIDRKYGRLDGLVNNAGVGTPGDVEQTSFSEWRRVMAIRPCWVTSAWMISRPSMTARGIRREISCCGKWRTPSAAVSESPMWWAGWAAMNSPCSCRKSISTERGTPSPRSTRS